MTGRAVADTPACEWGMLVFRMGSLYLGHTLGVLVWIPEGSPIHHRDLLGGDVLLQDLLPVCWQKREEH